MLAVEDTNQKLYIRQQFYNSNPQDININCINAFMFSDH